MNVGEDTRSVEELVSDGVKCDLWQGINLKCEVITFWCMHWDHNQIINILRWLCWNCKVIDFLDKHDEKVCIATLITNRSLMYRYEHPNNASSMDLEGNWEGRSNWHK